MNTTKKELREAAASEALMVFVWRGKVHVAYQRITELTSRASLTLTVLAFVDS